MPEKSSFQSYFCLTSPLNHSKFTVTHASFPLMSHIKYMHEYTHFLTFYTILNTYKLLKQFVYESLFPPWNSLASKGIVFISTIPTFLVIIARFYLYYLYLKILSLYLRSQNCEGGSPSCEIKSHYYCGGVGGHCEM